MKVVNGANVGLSTLYDMLGVAQLIFEEFENLNVQSSLLPSGGAATGLTPAASPLSPVPRMSSSPATPASTGSSSNVLDGVNLTLTGEEALQDSLTRLAVLRDRYVTLSSELEKAIAIVSSSDARQDKTENVDDEAVMKRDELRKDVYERNVVMKELIEKVRQVQQTMLLANDTRDETQFETL